MLYDATTDIKDEMAHIVVDGVGCGNVSQIKLSKGIHCVPFCNILVLTHFPERPKSDCI